MSILVTSIQLEHIPHPHSVYLTLFKNVRNSGFLREQLLSGNTEFEYAFIDATTIISTVHVLAAVHQALHNLLIGGKLRTRNVHSEAVFCLSPNNNPTTSSLICIKVSTPSTPVTTESVQSHLEKVVEGDVVELTDENLLKETVVDWAKVGKNYKLKFDRTSRETMASENPVRGLKNLEVEILGKLVIRAVG